MKTCNICNITKPLEKFYKNKAGGQGVMPACKQCQSIKYKGSHLQRTYGISNEDYNVMFKGQEGCCAICGRHQREFKKRLHVDHNHTTGQVRALLCAKCNTGLGHYELYKDNYENYLSLFPQIESMELVVEEIPEDEELPKRIDSAYD